jgi:hypothetical protein
MRVVVNEWLTKRLEFFRRLEFFQAQAAMSNAELAEWLANRDGVAFDISDPLADLRLVRGDRDRVWWNDTEADVCESGDVYRETLLQWARISRGAFTPTAITERWDSEEGPITVTFDHGGRLVTLNPEYANDWTDLEILIPLNRLLEPSGIQFELYEAFDQTAFIVALKAHEKAQLIRERGWRFAGAERAEES